MRPGHQRRRGPVAGPPGDRVHAGLDGYDGDYDPGDFGHRDYHAERFERIHEAIDRVQAAAR